VVLLNPGFSVDEHEDWASETPRKAAEAFRETGPRVHTIADGMSPARNLAVQSAVISRARAFVGTYGGYSYLAPLYGVPAVAFYSRPTFKRHHLYAAQRAFDQTGAAALTLVDTTQAAVVQSTIGAVVGTHS
jgi:ADP-heptose:LPS heptosyltransferase